jgi:hypothetical protein
VNEWPHYVKKAKEIVVRLVTYLHRSRGGCQLDFMFYLIKLKVHLLIDAWGEMYRRGGCALRCRL